MSGYTDRGPDGSYLREDDGLDDEEPQGIAPEDEFPKVCGFCKGEPVGDAASWLDGKPRPPAPCPRCGVVTPRSPGVSAGRTEQANA